MNHTHPITGDITVYTIDRKESPTIMCCAYITACYSFPKEQSKRQEDCPEALTIDATYKTNAHEMYLVNIVGTSSVSSIKKGNKLDTFAVAGGFIISETEAT